MALKEWKVRNMEKKNIQNNLNLLINQIKKKVVLLTKVKKKENWNQMIKMIKVQKNLRLLKKDKRKSLKWLGFTVINHSKT